MNDDAFWQFVNECGASPAADANTFVTAWKATINRLSPDELVELNSALANNLRRACTWDLWGIAYIMNGGCTDSGFLYFRQWLISRGRALFEAALQNPDELASLTPPNLHSPLEIAELDLALGDLWEEKTGIDQFDTRRGFPDEDVDLQEPAGQKWNEDAICMSSRFPKCWARFVELTAVR